MANNDGHRKGNSQMASKLLHQMTEAGTILGVGRTTLYDLAAKGEIDVVHIGRRALVTDESLRAFVDRLKTGDGAAA